MLFTVKSKMQKVRYFAVRGTDMGQDGVWRFCDALWIQRCVQRARGAVACNRIGPQ